MKFAPVQIYAYHLSARMCADVYNGTPLKGHPSTKDIYVIKDTYQSPKYHVTAIFYP